MSIKTPEELKGMRAVAAVVRAMLVAMRSQVRPGISTRELDRIGTNVMRDHGARSAPALVYGFPGTNCISVNDEAVHGIPSERTIRDGDLVKLDVTLEKDGFMADAAVTVGAGVIADESKQLTDCGERAFARG